MSVISLCLSLFLGHFCISIQFHLSHIWKMHSACSCVRGYSLTPSPPSGASITYRPHNSILTNIYLGPIPWQASQWAWRWAPSLRGQRYLFPINRKDCLNYSTCLTLALHFLSFTFSRICSWSPKYKGGAYSQDCQSLSDERVTGQAVQESTWFSRQR